MEIEITESSLRLHNFGGDFGAHYFRFFWIETEIPIAGLSVALAGSARIK